ncbi:hypothetical protein DYBT9275_01535 [Dyadobacter sp. CECT 9275]|uniref:Beta-ketoacyl synthase-like N-terminal domain-containing protein n=1 Tax=Dyadobacter helix TaxID=2822344 RepID=A0A916JAG5_9BACT|nr:beta-ketoacyl synthase chain length factor [Dyadobacter sp. CECT 9275]CAG4995049.1 hypothetical protein DYBT9275_01535 [Dyadobacter sp. CECT 9275]
MYYITAASSITHQPSFGNDGFSSVISPLAEGSELIQPNYKEYIEAGLLRRMSKILRMSVACSKDCLRQTSTDQPDAIVVGTGLGCLLDTEKFLNNVLTLEGMLPPTSFIQSTHNTIAGQISLSLGNHGYNMTHTQNTLSFEYALQDALLLLAEEQRNILVGASDEHIPFLNEVSEHLGQGPADIPLTSGASFFMVSEERENALAEIIDVEVAGAVQDIPAAVTAFLAHNGLTAMDLDLVLYPSADFGGSADFQFVKSEDAGLAFVEYLPYSGLYATASAFALHFAVDRFGQGRAGALALVCNRMNRNLGLTLIRSVEA